MQQGILISVAIATSATFEEFVDNSRKALKWLFYSGLRGQQAFPVTSIEPSIVQDALEGGKGTPNPMLSITGLSLKELKPHIAKTNKHLPSISQLFVSLNNGPKVFVITGPSKALFRLITSLRKIKAPNGLNQSKVPFSQRKPVFPSGFWLLVCHITAISCRTCICHYHISIVGLTQTYFIYPHRDLPTTQKKKVLPWCWDRSAYQYGPLGEQVGWLICRGCWMGGRGCEIEQGCWVGVGDTSK